MPAQLPGLRYIITVEKVRCVDVTMVVVTTCVCRSRVFAPTIVMCAVDRWNVVKERDCFKFKRLFRRKKATLY
jgi:hypothetical protein